MKNCYLSKNSIADNTKEKKSLVVGTIFFFNELDLCPCLFICMTDTLRFRKLNEKLLYMKALVRKLPFSTRNVASLVRRLEPTLLNNTSAYLVSILKKK